MTAADHNIFKPHCIISRGFCNFMKTSIMADNQKIKLAPAKVYYKRLWKNAIFSTSIMLFCLLIGVLGYKFTIPEMDWYDSLLNASMILSGMGPMIDPAIILSKSAKIFAAMYALFSGVAFISTIGILIGPIAHRFFHKMHLEDTSGNL
jgi:hypothetical protein